MPNELVEVSKAERALAEAKDLDEILAVRDTASAAHAFATARNLAEKAQEIKILQLRAERKAGEWLSAFGPKAGGEGGGTLSHDGTTLPSLSISRNQSSRWQLQAALPEVKFNEWVEGCRKSGKEITAGGLRREARAYKRSLRVAEDVEAAEGLDDMGKLWQLHTMGMSDYTGSKSEASAIITDPPYQEDAVALFEDLGSLAEHCLEPGGSLIAMVGQRTLPFAIGILKEYLTYQWTLAYLMPGAHALMYQKKVNNAWKPILWFVNGPYARHAITDVITAGDAEKDLFNWQQGEAGFAGMVRAFTRPDELVIDPMCGTGTTGVASVKLSRRFVGIDIDPERIASAKVRLSAI